MENIKLVKYSKPTPIQRFAIAAGLKNRDLMACAQTGACDTHTAIWGELRHTHTHTHTRHMRSRVHVWTVAVLTRQRVRAGSGKTAAFLFPILSELLSMGKRVGDHLREEGARFPVTTPQALIVAPTRELAVQIYDECRKFCYRTWVRPVVIYGGADSIRQLRDMQDNGCHLMVCTPGRLNDLIERRKVSLRQTKYGRAPIRGAGKQARTHAHHDGTPSARHMSRPMLMYVYVCVCAGTWCWTRRTVCLTWVLSHRFAALSSSLVCPAPIESASAQRRCLTWEVGVMVRCTDLPKERQTLMFSATFPKEVQRLAAQFLRDYVFLTIGRVGSTSENITQVVRP
jgi:superfamily II DNA/RNA helicase